MTNSPRDEGSVHEVKVYRVLAAHKEQWLTNKEIATLAEGVSERTVRAHTNKLVRMQVIDLARGSSTDRGKRHRVLLRPLRVVSR
jgi:hypothetical protein